jgi:hypothetical protein
MSDSAQHGAVQPAVSHTDGFADAPFVNQPPADLTTATRCAEVAAAAWSLPTPTLLRMSMNAIFRAGDVIIRVGRPSVPGTQAVALRRLLVDAGLRVPRLLHDEVITHDGHSAFAIGVIDEVGDVDWHEVGTMVRRLHEIPRTAVSAIFPTPWCGSFAWWDFPKALAETRPSLDRVSWAALDQCVERNLPLLERARQGAAVVCHGDVHPGNVMQSSDGPVLLDWDLVCLGPRQWDHAALMPWTERWGGATGLYEAFAVGYGESMRRDPTAEAIAVLRLAAATLMRVRAAQANPAALPEAQQRLRWWRGEASAPTWTAQ